MDIGRALVPSGPVRANLSGNPPLMGSVSGWPSYSAPSLGPTIGNFTFSAPEINSGWSTKTNDTIVTSVSTRADPKDFDSVYDVHPYSYVFIYRPRKIRPTHADLYVSEDRLKGLSALNYWLYEHRNDPECQSCTEVVDRWKNLGVCDSTTLEADRYRTQDLRQIHSVVIGKMPTCTNYWGYVEPELQKLVPSLCPNDSSMTYLYMVLRRVRISGRFQHLVPFPDYQANKKYLQTATTTYDHTDRKMARYEDTRVSSDSDYTWRWFPVASRLPLKQEDLMDLCSNIIDDQMCTGSWFNVGQSWSVSPVLPHTSDIEKEYLFPTAGTNFSLPLVDKMSRTRIIMP